MHGAMMDECTDMYRNTTTNDFHMQLTLIIGTIICNHKQQCSYINKNRYRIGNYTDI